MRGGALGKSLIVGAGLIAAAIFVIIAAAAIHRSPDIDGVLGGLFVALFMSLLFLGGVAWLAMWWLRPRSVPIGDDAAIDAVAARLQPVLAELEATRRTMVGQINRRALWRVPLCVAGGVVLWSQSHDGDLISDVLGSGLIGYFWAAHKLSERYRRMYKDRVLPTLAARFGAISYRAATPPDMDRLRKEHVFPHFDQVIAEDELAGTYRGLAVSIVELRLKVSSGKHMRIIFDGLLVEIELSRRLVGTTAIIADGGLFGNLLDWLHKQGRERVRLEDPRFESVYQVWGSDQVAARALLTPAFMERLLALADRPGLDPPLALVRDNRLTMALPKARPGDYFEPPSYLKPAASRQALVRLDKDIAAVLAAADAVIDLDSLTRNAASASTAPSRREQQDPALSPGMSG